MISLLKMGKILLTVFVVLMNFGNVLAAIVTCKAECIPTTDLGCPGNYFLTKDYKTTCCCPCPGDLVSTLPDDIRCHKRSDLESTTPEEAQDNDSSPTTVPGDTPLPSGLQPEDKKTQAATLPTAPLTGTDWPTTIPNIEDEAEITTTPSDGNPTETPKAEKRFTNLSIAIITIAAICPIAIAVGLVYCCRKEIREFWRKHGPYRASDRRTKEESVRLEVNRDSQEANHDMDNGAPNDGSV